MNIPKQEPETILIIEDDAALAHMLRTQVEHWGYRALTASTGEAGLALAAQARPDVILLDVLLPTMKGREVCSRLKADAATQPIPVIMVSALGMAEHIKAGLEAGAADYLTKPFQPEELRNRIEVCLLRAQAATDHRPEGR